MSVFNKSLRILHFVYKMFISGSGNYYTAEVWMRGD